MAFQSSSLVGLAFAKLAAEFGGRQTQRSGGLFDVAIIAVDDLFYTDGPLFAATSPAHAGTAISAVIMSGAVIAALFYRPAERTFRAFGWTGLFLLLIYVINSYVLFLIGQ